MEDSIGTIFYIVLTVIVLIITFINRKKRQKEAASKPQKEEKNTFDPFELFKEDSMEPATEVSDQRIPPEPRDTSVRSKLESYIDESVSAFSEKPSREERFENRTSSEMVNDDKEEQPPGETNECGRQGSRAGGSIRGRVGGGQAGHFGVRLRRRRQEYRRENRCLGVCRASAALQVHCLGRCPPI